MVVQCNAMVQYIYLENKETSRYSKCGIFCAIKISDLIILRKKLR